MGIGGLALPNGQYLPTALPQLSQIDFVPLHIALELSVPEFRVLLGPGAPEFAGVSMPKATVNKYNFLVAWEY